MGHEKTDRRRSAHTALGLCMLLALCLLALGAAPAQAAKEHVFDPTLSLRGDCSTNVLDEVPDPGLCPGTAGVDHPPLKFEQPCGTAADPHGDIYVANAAQGPDGEGKGGRIDVFNPKGEYLAEIKDENMPCGVAVDSKGNVYVIEYKGKTAVLFKAKAYPPAKGAGYEARKVVHAVEPAKSNGGICTNAWAVAVDPSNDHVYVSVSCEGAFEYDSVASGGALLKKHEIDTRLAGRTGLAVYGRTHDIYSSGVKPGVKGGTAENDPANARVLVFDGASDALQCEIDGTETPQGGFGFKFGNAGVAVDQSNGDVYVDDINETSGHGAVDQFGSDCKYIGQITHSFKPLDIAVGGAALAYDAPCLDALSKPCGGQTYDSPNEGHLYVGQGGLKPNTYRVFAFGPKGEAGSPPVGEEQAVGEITDTEAVLSAKLSPGGLQTAYHFEYTTQADFEANGYTNATSVPVPEADGGDEVAFKAVSEPIAGLEPDTAYRFRLVASNCEAKGAVPGECLTQGEGAPGKEGTDVTFSTYLSEEGALPDGRAYELVTPPDTNGRIPTMSELGSGFNGSGFNTALASADGDSVAWGVEGGSIPALGGGGYHDTYEAVRGPEGWTSHFDGVSGAQAETPLPGGIAADHGFAFWQVEGANGSLATAGGKTGTNYIRRPGGVLDPACSPEPEGEFELVGCGSLGTEPHARGAWISPGGEHVIFFYDSSQTGVPGAQIEPCAPAGAAVFDRTPDGVTHCVSVGPGDSLLGGAKYLGASNDGSAVAFKVGSTLYARLDDAETVEAASGETRFGGLSADGSRLFYLRPSATEPLLPGTKIPQGEIFLCPVRLGSCAGPEAAQEPIEIGSGEESVLVNVSADGSHVYFVSPKQLDGGKGTAGKDNLYRWDEAEGVRFVATLTSEDVEGRLLFSESRVGGLGLWVTHALKPNPRKADGAAADPSRTSADGTVLLFESHARLTAYDNAGRSEIYRYDSTASEGEELTCVSCNPTGIPAGADAQLQSDPGAAFAAFPPVTDSTPVANLTEGGGRAFFQSAEQLVLGDVDGKIDVYEWEAQGTGGCEREGGCVSLVSGGRSAGDDFLYAATPSGSDVFFESGDLLVAEDLDSTPSVYDAREGGGFPAPVPPPGECLGEACQPVASAPDDPTPASLSFSGAGNQGPEPSLSCPKGKRKVRSKGKVRCLPAHHKHHRAKHKRRGGR